MKKLLFGLLVLANLCPIVLLAVSKNYSNLMAKIESKLIKDTGVDEWCNYTSLQRKSYIYKELKKQYPEAQIQRNKGQSISISAALITGNIGLLCLSLKSTLRAWKDEQRANKKLDKKPESFTSFLRSNKKYLIVPSINIAGFGCMAWMALKS